MKTYIKISKKHATLKDVEKAKELFKELQKEFPGAKIIIEKEEENEKT